MINKGINKKMSGRLRRRDGDGDASGAAHRRDDGICSGPQPQEEEEEEEGGGVTEAESQNAMGVDGWGLWKCGDGNNEERESARAVVEAWSRV